MTNPPLSGSPVTQDHDGRIPVPDRPNVPGRKAGSPEALEVVHFLQGGIGVVEVRLPEGSGIGVERVSRAGTERLTEGATSLETSELGDASIGNMGA